MNSVTISRNLSFSSTKEGGLEWKEDRGGCRGDGRGNSSSSSLGTDKIDALGWLLTKILRHIATELNLSIRKDGFVKVNDILKLYLETYANNPLSSHTPEDVREAVKKDNKQRFSLVEEDGELLIRANQGHSMKVVESASLLKRITSHEEVPVCIHGTYSRNLQSILESGLKRARHDANVLIFLDVRKVLNDGMKLYISDNKVILTEGFDGVVPVKYFKKMESWPDRIPIQYHLSI